jgi:hypothetical protein
MTPRPNGASPYGCHCFQSHTTSKTKLTVTKISPARRINGCLPFDPAVMKNRPRRLVLMPMTLKELPVITFLGISATYSLGRSYPSADFPSIGEVRWCSVSFAGMHKSKPPDSQPVSRQVSDTALGLEDGDHLGVLVPVCVIRSGTGRLGS